MGGIGSEWHTLLFATTQHTCIRFLKQSIDVYNDANPVLDFPATREDGRFFVEKRPVHRNLKSRVLRDALSAHDVDRH